MFSYSEFKHDYDKSIFNIVLPLSDDYAVNVNGKDVPVYTCRTSKIPFNIPWPGYQRPIEQTQIVSFINLVSDEELFLTVKTTVKYNSAFVKPFSKGIKVDSKDETIKFSIKENGFYVLHLDDTSHILYIFNNKDIPCENKKKTTYYFGAGIYYKQNLVLKDNDTVYLDKDAYVYGNIYAENAKNIRVYGNGIFDDGGEARYYAHGYEEYTNGNIKFYDCKNISIEGVGFVDSAMWCVNIFHCENVKINGIKVFGQWRYNTDGIDIVNSTKIRVDNSFIHSFDDTITIKGIDRYEKYNNTDMVFSNCVLWCDWGKTCEIGIETACELYDDISFIGCDILRAGNTAFDIQNGDYAVVQNITFKDCSVDLNSYDYEPQMQFTFDTKFTGEKGYVPRLLSITNQKFKKICRIFTPEQTAKACAPNTGKVNNVLVENINVYYDDKIKDVNGKKQVYLYMSSTVEETDFNGVTVKNVFVNGKKYKKDDYIITAEKVKNLVIE